MTCRGGAGARRVPIFARVERISPSTGKVDLIITDRDGYEGTSTAIVTQNYFEMDGIRGAWDKAGRSTTLKVDVCPNGMLIERL